MLNKKGESEFGGDLLMDNVIYLVLFLVFFSVMFYYVLGLQDGVALWEDVYAKEITRVVNSARPGEEVCLDVTKAMEIGLERGKSKSDLFNFDNVNNEVIVSLRQGRGTAYKFFNNVDLVNKDIKELVKAEPVVDQLCFELVEVQLIWLAF